MRFGNRTTKPAVETEMTRVFRPGGKVFLTFEDDDLNLFDQDTGERLSL